MQSESRERINGGGIELLAVEGSAVAAVDVIVVGIFIAIAVVVSLVNYYSSVMSSVHLRL